MDHFINIFFYNWYNLYNWLYLIRNIRYNTEALRSTGDVSLKCQVVPGVIIPIHMNIVIFKYVNINYL